jgi:hypothetical protein
VVLSQQVKLTMDSSFHGKLEGGMVQQQDLRNAGMVMLCIILQVIEVLIQYDREGGGNGCQTKLLP